MEFEIVSGRFVPGQDTLSVRGSFNGWSNVDIFSQSVGDPNIYELTTIIPTTEGETINFKYAFTRVQEEQPGKATLIKLIHSQPTILVQVLHLSIVLSTMQLLLL
jgi:hypothetical protein